MFFISGITGRVGGATTQHLLEGGHKVRVRALVRDPQKASDWAAQGVELREGDLNDPVALAACLEGVEGAFLMQPRFTLRHRVNRWPVPTASLSPRRCNTRRRASSCLPRSDRRRAVGWAISPRPTCSKRRWALCPSRPLLCELAGLSMQQHQNVVDAAKEAGVQCLAYTSRNLKDVNTLANKLMVGHFQTENAIKERGLLYVIFRHALYMDVLPFYVRQNVLDTGIALPAGEDRVAFALRSDMGKAIANWLLEGSCDQKIYQLTGTSTVGASRLCSSSRPASYATRPSALSSGRRAYTIEALQGA